MIIEENISLRKYNTFGLDYTAAGIIHLHTEEKAASLLKKQRTLKEPLFVIGGGSNLLFMSDFKGTLLHPQFGGITIESRTADNVTVSAGAGINWDNLVEWTVENGLSGLENLSLIPGDVGAAPVQNIGAYGVEVSDIIEKVETIHIKDGSSQSFSNRECGFAYRDSIFKGKEKGNYIVTRVFFRLGQRAEPKLDYGSIREELEKIGNKTPGAIRQAVINIRRSKLPDPAEIGNAGSFFKNPVVSGSEAHRLLKEYPKMPFFRETNGMIKLAAGWLIEQCGWKGHRYGNAGIYDKQALIIINHGDSTGLEIYDLSEKVRISVREKFGIDLEHEVEILSFT
jgi:UDP-N-acetylmuramate dehydrogenase